MHTEYFLLTADVTVQMPVTLIVPTHLRQEPPCPCAKPVSS